MPEMEKDPTERVAEGGALPAPSVAPDPAVPEAWSTPPPPPPALPPGGGRHPWRWIVAMVVTWAIIAGVAGTAIGWTLARSINASRIAQTQTSPVASPLPSEAPITPVSPGSNSSSGTLNIDAITAKVSPAIVDISTVINGGSAAGTGMIVTSSGEVLTNNHVVNGSTSITVTIKGHSGHYTAHVIGVAPNSDVALIQIEGISGLPTVTLADASRVQVGDRVVAIGNALGQGDTATQGQVVALEQDITASTGGGRSEDLHGLIQSDAPISPGDSGGALVNSSAQVIGMITAGEAQGFRSSTTTVAYSIPTNDALDVVNKIRAGQSSAEIIIGPVGYLGVQIRDLNPQTAAQLGLTMTSGALVWGVQSGSPAADAGIARYSVITSVEGKTVTSADSLGEVLHQYKPGAKVKVGWIDQEGKSHTATVTLTTGPNI
jgi:S1-C subfamily serine protease